MRNILPGSNTLEAVARSRIFLTQFRGILTSLAVLVKETGDEGSRFGDSDGFIDMELR